ncbi:PREDICTED: uncharacterized protein LOC109148624 [Ipomoea nil]|uniref:uncharacterized protein LOC109148624 n=1 Tax=Ipomoea nil TaxID=35883 RepID=UPI00090132BD|nr:PREDICTED: uncharacterized protein LOC109148624 [Ipomoea nil]
MNATISSDSLTIASRVHNHEVILTSEDIRTMYGFPQRDDSYMSNLTHYYYDPEDFYVSIKNNQGPAKTEISWPLKKKWFRLNYEFTVDIFNKVVDHKTSGTDDVTKEKLKMLHAFLNEIKVDWSKIIFNNLIHTITYNRKSPGDVAKKLGYGFMVSHLLVTKGILMRPGIRSGPKACHMKQKPSGYDKQKGEEVTKEAHPQGEAQPKVVLPKRLSDDQDPETDLVPSQVPHPQEPTLVEQLPHELTQEPADVEIEASRLSLPQEPGSPEKTKEASDALIDMPSHPQEPTNAEQVILTQEPTLVDETAMVPVATPDIPKPSAPAPEVSVPQPSPDKLLRESIERDYQRVLQWQKWRTAPLRSFIETFEAMQDEEEFALNWIGTDDVYKSLRLEEIRRVFSYKMTNRTLGKDKAPLCIDLNKPPLDPALEEEMKQLRYAMLLSKIKTTLEKEHQNDLNCNVSGTKDEHGQEIEEDESDMNEEDENDDDDIDDVNDDDDDIDDVNDDDDDIDDVNDDDDDDDADDEHDDDDDDNDNDGNLGNAGVQGADSEDSDPILIGPDYDTFPQRSPLRKLPSDSDDPKEASNEHPEDLSRTIVPLVQPMDETPIKQEKESAREGKLEASPILLSSASGGKSEAPPQNEQMDTTPTNFEEESTAEPPRTIMNLMRETVHSAETIHLQYLVLRQKDTKVLDDLCKKVDLLMAAQSQPQPPPQEQPQPSQHTQSDHKFLERIAKRLHELDTTMNKVAQQQHELKHSLFGLKERVDLACTKIDTYQDNSYQLGEYALQILGYAQYILVARDDDKDKDDDHPRNNTKDQSPEAKHSPSRTPRDSGRRNTNPSHPPSRSRGHHSSKPRYHGRYQSRSLKPRQSFGTEAKYIFTEGSGKRFEGCNVPTWLKTRDNHTRQDHISTQNERIKRENRELWKKHDEEIKRREDEAKERERIRNLIEDLSSVTKDSPQSVIHNVAFKVHKESGKSYQEGMNSFELISWWKAGIVEGRNIREAYNNYTSLNIKGEHEELVKTNPIKIFRKKINEKIDFKRMLKQQKEKDCKEQQEAAQQKSKLLEIKRLVHSHVRLLL